MKKSVVLIVLVSITSILSCNKKKEEVQVKYNDNLLVVKNQDINKLIRDYSAYEANYVKAYEKQDFGMMKLYSDSANMYDRKLFDKQTQAKLDAKERIQYSDQINTIRTNKIKALKEVEDKKPNEHK